MHCESHTMAAADLLLEVESLSWRLLDNQLTPAEMPHFESLLLNSRSAIQTYIDCVQIHIGFRDLLHGPMDLLSKCELESAKRYGTHSSSA